VSIEAEAEAETVAVSASTASQVVELRSRSEAASLGLRDRRGEMAVRKALGRGRFGPCTRIGDEAVVSLVIEGVEGASRRAGVSGRTLRRHFSRNGSSISAFVAGVRLEAARDLFSQGWDTGEVAVALGYSGAAAFRRFLRQNSRVGVWTLRRAADSPGEQ
jgi:hypothetical protein